MSTIPIKIKALPGSKIPEYKTQGSAGLDVSAHTDAVIPAGGWAAVGTGLYVEIPEGYEIQVRSRSGLALNNGIFVLNTPGTIDSDYRGEIKVILANFSKQDFTIKAGDRIAQLIPAQLTKLTFVSSTELSETDRGHGGFGHTGTK